MGVRPNKFSAVRTTVDGITFASKREAARYGELKLLERAGEISRLSLQPEFVITINGVKICKYIADFRYVDPSRIGPRGQKGMIVVEDVKGVKTAVYRLKKKMTEAFYPGLIIDET
jgi:hypothetical protein